ncbi:hypothetical protein ACLOJK_039597 [Asimina triloba]
MACGLLSSKFHVPVEAKQDVGVRRTAKFHPSVWGDFFLNCTQDDATDQKMDAWTKRVEELKGEVKSLMSNLRGSVQEMELINDIQRLGVAYHFEKEIEEALHSIYASYSSSAYDDLWTVSLRFRLLRQEGYNVSPDAFMEFKDANGQFDKSLASDPRGMLSLYEATYLGTHGEDILDEAIAFTSELLKALIPHLDHHLARQVERALELPLRKRIQRIEARHYISVYEEDVSPNNMLLELAKLDFNILQSLHQMELKQLSKWWSKIDLAKKLNYVRDRVVEGYFWTLAVYFEQKYSRARLLMTKMFGIILIMDDTYDAYGTLEELELFTDAIQRWDLGAKDQLPSYMQVCFQIVLDTVEEIAELLTPEERSYRVPYLKEVFKTLMRGYLVESQWCSSGYVPTFDEYLRTALITCGYSTLTICAFAGMGEMATKEAFEWVLKDPKILRASNIVCRLMDDIQSAKFEQERGHVASSIDCYMNEQGVSEEEACKKLREMVAAAWKDINQEWLQKPTPIPKPLLIRPPYLTCVIEILYMYGDGFNDSTGQTKAQITQVLVRPIPV